MFPNNAHHQAISIGIITVCQWVDSMETVLQLGLPWHTLKHQLTQINKDGRVVYSTGLDEFCVKDKLKVITLIKVHHLCPSYRLELRLQKHFIATEQQ